MKRHSLSSTHLSIALLAFMLSACTGSIQDSTTSETELQDPATSSTTPSDIESNEQGTPSGSQGDIEQVVGSPAENSTDNPVENPTETPVDDPTEEPVEESITPADDLERENLDDPTGDQVSLVEPPVVESLNRTRRRMNLDQLNLAIRQVTGGLWWSEVRNNQEEDLFVTLSDTLGKPDYVQSTTEDLTPSALFLKFLDDAARQVCDKRITLDLEAMNDPRIESAPDSIKLWGGLSLETSMQEDSQAVEAQIRALVLRFHSHQLPDGDSARLAYWRWLFETATFVDGQPLSGWRALCVALINHPDFYSY